MAIRAAFAQVVGPGGRRKIVRAGRGYCSVSRRAIAGTQDVLTLLVEGAVSLSCGDGILIPAQVQRGFEDRKRCHVPRSVITFDSR